MNYVLVVNGVVEVIFHSIEEVPVELAGIVKKAILPEAQPAIGQDYYYLYNGTEVEVKYVNRPLTNLEKLSELDSQNKENEQAILELSMVLGGTISV
ncbi:hypothetical protein NDK25_22085 [Niallia taxi]|nr:hypothetical protein [Niallia taxi]MDE5054908.1 hypothetical protein [Niallia taxi]